MPTDGPVLVLAGAGTGKTRVLTTRLAHILAIGPGAAVAGAGGHLHQQGGARDARAGRERCSAARSRAGGSAPSTPACARMLRGHAERVGLKPSFTILDTDDQLRLLKQLLEARDIDAKKLPPRLFSSVIQRWKDRGLTPGAGDRGGRARTRSTAWRCRSTRLPGAAAARSTPATSATCCCTR